MNFIKTICRVVLLASLPYANAIAQQECDNPESSEKVRIYYGSGMNNTGDDIIPGLGELKKVMGRAEDRSFGSSINTLEGFLTQMLKVGRQRRVDDREKISVSCP